MSLRKIKKTIPIKKFLLISGITFLLISGITIYTLLIFIYLFLMFISTKFSFLTI